MGMNKCQQSGTKAEIRSQFLRTSKKFLCCSLLNCDPEDGATLRLAERRKRSTYPELCGPGPQRLLVLGAEVGGRWNSEARSFLRTRVRLRSLRAPAAAERGQRVGATLVGPDRGRATSCGHDRAWPSLARPTTAIGRRWSESSTWLTARGQPSHPCGRPRSLGTSADETGSCRRKKAVGQHAGPRQPLRARRSARGAPGAERVAARAAGF